MSSPDKLTPAPAPNNALEHVAEAHQQLKSLRNRLGYHPELDEAINNLELALSALTLQTGGLL